MPQTADLIIRNARVLTMDEASPKAEAVAVAGNSILAVGSNDAIVALAGPSAKVIDAKGADVSDITWINEATRRVVGFGNFGTSTNILVDGVARADGAIAAFVEGFEHGMQPQAEITFVHHVLQFVRLLQAQLAQGEETVGAAAQVFVGTGRQARDRQRLALGRGPRRRRGGHGPGPARVLGLDPPPRLQQKFLHQRAGQQGFTSRV